MAMRNEGLQKTFLSAAATAANRILKIGADNNHMIVATAATDKLMAVSDNLGADAAEEPFDVILDGVALVKAGGAIRRCWRPLRRAPGTRPDLIRRIERKTRS
jgi:hypothetical protein